MDVINPIAWFGDRELETVPPHFVKSTTSISTQSLTWVRNKLLGRYSLSSRLAPVLPSSFIDLDTYIYFEDPKELVIFELRWSGSK